MRSSLPQSILRRVRGRGRGSVFTAQDFLDLGNRAAVDQALSRLSRQGLIRRVARGIYDLPRLHPVIGQVAPSQTAVVQAVARQTNSRLHPSGAAAANALGLSTQVPARPEWVTDGPSRRVQLGRQTVVLRHGDALDLLFPGQPAGLVVSALRHLGKGALSRADVQQLAARLPRQDKRRLAQARARLPSWMRPTIDRIARS